MWVSPERHGPLPCPAQLASVPDLCRALPASSEAAEVEGGGHALQPHHPGSPGLTGSLGTPLSPSRTPAPALLLVSR